MIETKIFIQLIINLIIIINLNDNINIIFLFYIILYI